MTEELFREDAYARSCAAEVVFALDGGVRLDRTVFYCQGGGQPGDRGRLLLADGAALEVVDTTRVEGSIMHRLAEGGPVPAAGTRLIAEIDCDAPLRHLILFTPPGKPFFAVEPVSNANNGFNLLAAGVEGSDVEVLAPGDTLRTRFGLRVLRQG